MPEPHTVTQMASRSQREAITHTFGPCLVIAGPGSGKTFVLVEHIVFLIESLHIPPSKILVLTFSRAAAGQMRDRFLRRISADTTSVTFGTFHSVFYHILRETTGRPWPVIGEEERRRFAAMLTRNLWPEKALRPLPDQLLSDISRYKSCGGRDFTPSAAVGDPRLFSRALRSYGAFLKESSCIDLDDMITECRRLLQRDRDARGRWMARFPFLLVDEYQDINRDQYALLRLLAGDRANLFAVGDDDQSIYGFRGSDPRIMTGFVRDFPGCRRVFLETNYRCGRPIVQKAALVIGENRERIPKKIRAASPAGDPVVLRGWADEREEFTRLADALQSLDREELDGTAVIFRSHAGEALLAGILERRQIPYRCQTGSVDHLRLELLRDLLAYYRCAAGLAAGQVERSGFLRIMNRPDRGLDRERFGAGKIESRQLLRMARDGGREAEGLAALLDLLRFLGRAAPAASMDRLCRDGGYGKAVPEGYSAGADGRAAAVLSEMTEKAAACPGPENWIRLLEDECRQAEQPRQAGEDASAGTGVRLMTMHGAKGLEFDRVYLPELNEDVIPGRRAVTRQQVEEERRLLYVGMTRARKHLELWYLSGTRQSPRRPSRFLKVLGVRSPFPGPNPA